MILLAAAMALAQEPPQFRVDVGLVTVSVTVRASSGQLLADLTKDDFQILEDGVPQTIRVFARRTDLPLNLALIVDASGSQSKFFKRHRRDLERFLESALEPRDRAFLLGFGNRLRVVSDFTASVEQIMTNLELYDDGKLRGAPVLGPPEEERELGTALYDAVFYGVEERLRRTEAGRRAMLVFSDGEENSSAHTLLDAIEAAQSADTTIYSIRYADQNPKRIDARGKYGRRALQQLAEHTGGRDYDAMAQGMKETFRAIAEELRSTYEIGYVSSNAQRDGQFRKIAVRVNREGAVARAKPGYFAR
ncbi:MAG: VWA domain-containing protein [Bryobacteraceae bacterium]|nr:VWA domain-containing protein [Bryobacteraceae bacterium]